MATSQTRREFLATLGAASLATGCGRAGAAGGRVVARPLARIGVQLYTVRHAAARDLAAVLAQLAAIGYTDVEFAGYHGRSPREVRALLDASRLRAPSVHVPIDTMRGGWARALEDARAVGHEYVTIPWIPDADRRTLDDYRRLAGEFNAAARKAREAGLKFAYHNHDFELRAREDDLPLEVLLRETEPGLVDFQLDVYWAVRAGQDPFTFITRHPGRFRLLHLKDSKGAPQHAMTEVGGGVIDWHRVVTAGAKAGARHFFVEHDDPTDPFASVRASYAHLRSLAL